MAVAPALTGDGAVDTANLENLPRQAETDFASLHLFHCSFHALATTPTEPAHGIVLRGVTVDHAKMVASPLTLVLLGAAAYYCKTIEWRMSRS